MFHTVSHTKLHTLGCFLPTPMLGVLFCTVRLYAITLSTPHGAQGEWVYQHFVLLSQSYDNEIHGHLDKANVCLPPDISVSKTGGDVCITMML